MLSGWLGKMCSLNQGVEKGYNEATARQRPGGGQGWYNTTWSLGVCQTFLLEIIFSCPAL